VVSPGRCSVDPYKGGFVANLVSFATLLAPPEMGQTRVAEVGLERGLYCYMFCDGSENSVRFENPSVANLSRQIAPSDSVVGSAPSCRKCRFRELTFVHGEWFG
jgi:hypothetical protein